MNKFAGILLLVAVGCTSGSKTTSTSKMGEGNTRTIPVQFLNNDTYLLTETTADSTYAFTTKNPVKVGGLTTDGVRNEKRFLNALLGPNGEPVTYSRMGSCCPFKTPNGFIDNSGLLDRYQVCYGKDTVYIYINMYDDGNLMIPKGMTARKKN